MLARRDVQVCPLLRHCKQQFRKARVPCARITKKDFVLPPTKFFSNAVKNRRKCVADTQPGGTKIFASLPTKNAEFDKKNY